MKFKTLVYYSIGYIIAAIIGYSINYIVGFMAASVLYLIALGIFSVILGLAEVDPVEKSIYERRKKDSE